MSNRTDRTGDALIVEALNHAGHVSVRDLPNHLRARADWAVGFGEANARASAAAADLIARMIDEGAIDFRATVVLPEVSDD